MSENVQETRPLSPSEAHEAKQSANIFTASDTIDPARTPSNVDSLLQPKTQESSSPESWSFDEGINGEGPRPAWLKEKYKTVAQQAAAYSELEKKLGEFKGAPKEGYKLEGTFEGLDTNDPMLQKFLPKFQELNMSQDAVNKLVGEWVDYKSSFATVSLEDEMKKLGPEGKELIDVNAQWMKNNFSPEMFDTMSGWVQTADDLRALNAIRTGQKLSSSPTAGEMKGSMVYESLKDIRSEKTQNWQKYQDDVAYRDGLNARMAAAVTRQEAKNKR